MSLIPGYFMRYRHAMLLGALGVILLFAPGLFRSSGLSYAQSAREEELTRFLNHGVFDPHKISEDALYQQIASAYHQNTDPTQSAVLADRLLKLKWWRLWESNYEMGAETLVVGHPLEPHFQPSKNWQWTPNLLPSPNDWAQPVRAHYSVPNRGTAVHSVRGTFPYILPANGLLRQYVYFPDDQIPEQIRLRIETGYLLGHQSEQKPVFVQARWTKQPEKHLATENRPDNFWAGTFPSSLSAAGRWYVLSVDLVDIGLCGRNRIIRGIEYHVSKGAAWFGPTLIRRPQVEIRGTQKYHLFEQGEPLHFTITAHNFSVVAEAYRVKVRVTNYDGIEIMHADYPLHISPKSSVQRPLTLEPGTNRYYVFDYTLQKEETILFHGYTAATAIVSNRTGRDDQSRFGLMYWDQPGQEMIDLYEKLGVKLVVIFPELDRLHAFDPQKFSVIPMIWSLPELDSPAAQKLREDVQPYLDAGQRIFSNFWETDLRVPPDIFAPNMAHFSRIIKRLDPLAAVGIGGLAWCNVAYVQHVLQTMKSLGNAEAFFDFLAVMSYTTPSPPEFSGIDHETEALTGLLQAHNQPDIEVWNVEWAYFENLNLDAGHWLNTGVPRHLVAPYTIRHHLLGFASGVQRMIPGTFLYAGRTPLAKNYGHSMTLGRSSVLRYDLAPLPLLPAYSVMTRMLEGKTYLTDVSRNPNIFCQFYQASDDRYTLLDSSPVVIVAWTRFGHERITLPIGDPEHDTLLRLLNMVGDERQQSTLHGALHLSVSPEPTYILADDAGAVERLVSGGAQTEHLLDVSPQMLEVSPGQSSPVTLTCHLSNPGWNALRGTVCLRHPDWMIVRQQAIRYADDVNAQLAQAILTEENAHSPDEFWLGRGHSLDVTYEVLMPADVPRTPYYEQFMLTQQPFFPITAELVAEEQVMARATIPVQIAPLLRVGLRPVLATSDEINAPRLVTQITNQSQIPRQGTLSLKVPDSFQVTPQQASFSLLPGHSQTYTFTLQSGVGFPGDYKYETVDSQLNRVTEQIVMNENQTIHLAHYRRHDGYLWSFGIGEGFVIEALVQDDQGYESRQSRGFAFRPAVKAKTPLRIDGALDDWRGAVPFFVHPHERLSGLTFFAQEYDRNMQWTGLDDFSSAWQMMWDEAFLYLAIRTYDDHIVPVRESGDFWHGDTISFQIDPAPDLTDASILPSQRDLRAIHTFEIGKNSAGPICRRKYATGGIVESINLAVQPVPDGLVYELAIPWDELTPLHPDSPGWMGFSLVFYEDDGYGREARSNWFGGTGGNGLAREPRLMGDVHFVR